MITLPGLVDRHVHLGLVDAALLAGGPVVAVDDLGWDPHEAAEFAAAPPPGVTVRYAGPFHTAPGGYPSGRPWAPPSSVRMVADPRSAVQAVNEAVGYGASLFKIALHASMPMLDDATLDTLIGTAHECGLAVVVHAEGEGQVRRAVAAGADLLAHAPWTEPVPDRVLAEGASMTWISTLAIHGPRERAVAIDNIRRFRAVGGTVVYGTDMGNGPTPVGVNEAEILALEEAGFDGEDLLAATLAPPGSGLPLLRGSAPLPHDGASLITWLTHARRLEPEEHP